jgi:hypothetical protein
MFHKEEMWILFMNPEAGFSYIFYLIFVESTFNTKDPIPPDAFLSDTD